MRALQKLCRNGNATSVTIPRPVLFHLGWVPGQAVIVDVLEDKTLHVRLPNERDFGPILSSRVVSDAPVAVKP